MMFEHGIEKCRVCDNYLAGADTCKFCSFKWRTDYPATSDKEFDIFELDDDIEWAHLQLMDRLKYKGIDCLFADIWVDNNLAILIGCNANKARIADALQVHEEVIYDYSEHGLVILNLFQEKYLRL